MGFNKLYTPSIEELVSKLTEIGEYEFGIHWHKMLMKANTVIGDPLACDMIKHFAEKAYNVQKANQKNKK